MKIFYTILAVICIVVSLIIIAFHLHTVMWGKIVLAFAAAFFVSAVMKLIDSIRNK
ncbi:hypothetical protein AALB39_07540 [Lachnospiraceae bacterium 54-53]